MLKFFIYAFLFALAALLQTTLVPKIEILEARPSLMLILTVIVALRHGYLAGCVLGFITGLLCDVYAPVEWLGAYSLSFCVVGYLTGQLEESFINLNLLPKLIILMIAFFLNEIIYFFAIGEPTDKIAKSLLFVSAPNAIYTVLIGAVFFYLLSLKTERRIEI